MVVIDHLALPGDAPCDSVHHTGRVSLGRWSSAVDRQALESLPGSRGVGVVQAVATGSEGHRHQVPCGCWRDVPPHGVQAVCGLPDRMLMVYVDLGQCGADEYHRLVTEHLTRVYDAAVARIVEHYRLDLAEGA